MTPAHLIMLALGLATFSAGLVLLVRRGGGEPAIYARRIAGMMLAALGLFLTVAAFGLSGTSAEPAR